MTSSRSPGPLLPVLSCVYLALYSQNACVRECLCVCVCVGGVGGVWGVCVCAYVLRIVSRDKILRFKNNLIIIIIDLQPLTCQSSEL